MNRKRGRWRVQLLLCSACPQALLQAHQAGLLGCTEIASLLCPILPPSTPMSAQALPDPWRPSCPAGQQRRTALQGCRPVPTGRRAGHRSGQCPQCPCRVCRVPTPRPACLGVGELGLILSAFALLPGLQATRGTAKALLQEEQRHGARGVATGPVGVGSGRRRLHEAAVWAGYQPGHTAREPGSLAPLAH